MDRETAGHGLEHFTMDRSSKTLSFQSSNTGPGNSELQPQTPLDFGKETPMIQKVPPNANILPSSDKFGDTYEIGDMYDPLIKRSVWAINEKEMKPYLRYLKNISDAGYQHIRWLADFMEVSTMPTKWKFLTAEDIDQRAKRTRVAMLDIFPDKEPIRKDFHTSDKLSQLFQEYSFSHDPEYARVFVVEDLSRDVIETFGAQYDIDPLFFRGHILDFLWYNYRDPWVELRDLEHIFQERNYYNIRYMIPKYFRSQESIESGVEELGSFNVLRRLEQELSWKVRQLRRIKGPSVGVIRSKASLWIRKNKPGETGIVAILVVDPTLKEGFPLWGGPRNQEPCPSMHDPVPRPPPQNSHFETVIHSTLNMSAKDITLIPSHPSVLSQPILSIVAAEWITVLTHITTTLTKIEYELEDAQYRDSSTGLTGALDRLHPLRRLMPVYKHMLSDVLATLLHPEASTPLPALHYDFAALREALEALQTRTQNIISLATTIISIEENQRAMKMNVNLVRVTYLAVIFVPMAFVSSFFSMTPDLEALERTIWVYFAVAVPLTVLCVAAADPRRVRMLWKSVVGAVRGSRAA